MEAEGDVATAFTLARILSNIPLSRGGPSSVVIFDIHALQVRLGLIVHIFRLLPAHFALCSSFTTRQDLYKMRTCAQSSMLQSAKF